jgi:NADPH:quinone reductase-like Zn-dependent oxidoreductase
VEIGEPKEGEIRVKNKAIGLNFIDVYFRKGVYKAAALPFTPGSVWFGLVWFGLVSAVKQSFVSSRHDVSYNLLLGAYFMKNNLYYWQLQKFQNKDLGDD